MAVQPGFNSTQINDTILASNIAQFIIPTPQATPLYEVLAMQLDLSGNKSNVVDIPSWDAFPATETTIEGDEVVSVNYSTSKKSLTGIKPSTRALITDQAMQDSMLLESDMVGQMVLNIRQTIDIGVLDLFNTATNVSDNTGVNLTITLWMAALAAFKAQKGQGTMCYVGSHNQIRDILKDLKDSAGGQTLGPAGASIFSSQVIDGYRGEYGGVHFFESGNVASNDADNDVGGFIFVQGTPGSAPTRSGLVLGVWHGVQAMGLYTPHRHGIDTTVSARVGFQRSAEYLVRGLISKKAA